MFLVPLVLFIRFCSNWISHLELRRGSINGWRLASQWECDSAARLRRHVWSCISALIDMDQQTVKLFALGYCGNIGGYLGYALVRYGFWFIGYELDKDLEKLTKNAKKTPYRSTCKTWVDDPWWSLDWLRYPNQHTTANVDYGLGCILSGSMIFDLMIMRYTWGALLLSEFVQQFRALQPAQRAG